MEKTKLGIPVNLVAAAAVLLGLYSGYMVTVALAVYVLLMEESAWLKKFVVKVVFLMLTFSVANTVVGFVPDVLQLLTNFTSVLNQFVYSESMNNIFNLLYNVLSLTKTVLFVVMGYQALSGKEIAIPAIDEFVSKQLEENA